MTEKLTKHELHLQAAHFTEQAITELVETAIEVLFKNMHEFAATKSGDISGIQYDKLDEIKYSLTVLLTEQVWDNLQTEDD